MAVLPYTCGAATCCTALRTKNRDPVQHKLRHGRRRSMMPRGCAMSRASGRSHGNRRLSCPALLTFHPRRVAEHQIKASLLRKHVRKCHFPMVKTMTGSQLEGREIQCVLVDGKQIPCEPERIIDAFPRRRPHPSPHRIGVRVHRHRAVRLHPADQIPHQPVGSQSSRPRFGMIRRRKSSTGRHQMPPMRRRSWPR